MSSRSAKTAFVVVCRDGPAGLSVRATHTLDHLAYIETVMDELNVAGCRCERPIPSTTWPTSRR